MLYREHFVLTFHYNVAIILLSGQKQQHFRKRNLIFVTIGEETRINIIKKMKALEHRTLNFSARRTVY